MLLYGHRCMAGFRKVEKRRHLRYDKNKNKQKERDVCMANVIKHIIFDMGNVLLRFDRELFLDRVGAAGEDRRALMQEVFCSDDWVGMDRGDHDEPQAAEKMCARLPEHLHGKAKALVCDWDDPLVPVAGMEELVAELKEAGFGIWLLSNASRRQHEYWPRLPVHRYFDGTLISADEGVIKPGEEIYRRCLEKFGLQAAECFFIDDTEANIRAAEDLGIRGHVFRFDIEALRRDLRAAGVI